MKVEALFVLAFIGVGAYRLYAVRHNRSDLIMWLLLIAGAIAVPLSKLVPAARAVLLPLAVLFLIAGMVMYARGTETKPDDSLRRPPG